VPPETDRRDELLDQLLELFLAEGLRQFTLGELAARLHCSKTTLYSLGHSKERVTVNTVVRFFQRAAQSVERRTAEETGPAERVVAYLQAVAAELRPASPAFMADVAAHPALHSVYERNTEAAARRLGELIAEGAAQGDFRAVHGAFVADTVAATMARIQSGEVARATGLRDADAYEELAALVLNGIRSGPTKLD
jgi:AcrR family transcriptional regulator